MSKSSSKQILVIVVTAGLIVPLVAASVFFSLRSRQPIELMSRKSQTRIPSDRDRMNTVGGISRPATDVRRPSNTAEATHRRKWGTDDGTKKSLVEIPMIKPDANKSVASAYEALMKRTNPERISPVFLPAEFNAEEYRKDPQAYLDIHEPGRVFRPAQPGPGVPVLAPLSEQYHRMITGETVTLSVKTEPNMPATFTSFDIGTFDNGLATISVAADKEGVAKATLHATPGKTGEVNILAASPVATEKVEFRVYITPKREN